MERLELLLTLRPDLSPDRPELIEVAGQSNALGFGLGAEDLPPHLRNPNGVTMIWGAGGWELMRPGVNTGTPVNPGAWGPEVEFAHDWHQAHPGQLLYVVKSVKGSTGLAEDDSQLDWSPRSHGELYDMATARFQAALSTLPNAHVTTLWVQGEEDAFVLDKARAYSENIRDLVEHIRHDWGSDQIALGQVSQPLPFLDLVRAGQATAPGAVLVDTTGFGLQADNLHFSAEGQIELGAHLYQATFAQDAAPAAVTASLFGSWFAD